MAKCYFCDNQATTQEHIPPRSFFAAVKYSPRRLIKVPSCELHNNEKNRDDEFFRNILSLHIEGEEYSRHLFDQKTIRSFRDAPKKYLEIMGSVKRIKIGDVETGVVSVDEARILDYFNKMAFGVYYHHNSRKCTSSFVIEPLSFRPYTKEWNTFRTMDRQKSMQYTKYGDYQEVFYYQAISENDQFIGFRMVFMGEITILSIVENQINEGH